MPLTAEQRAEVAAQLESSLALVADVLDGVSGAQWTFRPGPEEWSMAECAEHLAHSEERFFARIQTSLLEPPALPEVVEAAKGKEELIKRAVPNRGRRVKAPVELLTSPRFATPGEFLARFTALRRQTLDYALTTADPIDAHYFPHFVFGNLNGFQWMLMLAAHVQRHVGQMEEIKLHAGYPARGHTVAR
jgi:DinB superfamily